MAWLKLGEVKEHICWNNNHSNRTGIQSARGREGRERCCWGAEHEGCASVARILE